jgi:hypothetical protein
MVCGYLLIKKNGLWLSGLTFDGGKVLVIKLWYIENKRVMAGSGSRFKWVMKVQKSQVRGGKERRGRKSS